MGEDHRPRSRAAGDTAELSQAPTKTLPHLRREVIRSGKAGVCHHVRGDRQILQRHDEPNLPKGTFQSRVGKLLGTQTDSRRSKAWLRWSHTRQFCSLQHCC